ncbi:MAG: MltA domain-containing protein [Henriciella sp.]|nr:MltA domain-containing protein [Henriciella sp.]
MRNLLTLALVLMALTSCVTLPRSADPVPPAPQPSQQPRSDMNWVNPPKRVAFDRLPDWETANLTPGLAALRRSCAVFASRRSADYVSARATWVGTIDEWAPACSALEVIGDDASARAVIQALFTPVEIRSQDGASRFTGYFEPMYEARLSPEPPFTEPVPARPDDLVVEYGRVLQVLPDGRKRAYPSRAEITRNGVVPLAYAHPADVFFLQIQGSGRLLLPDGRTLRAAYAANNGQPFVSTANWLMSKGWIGRGEANMTGIKAWMNRTSSSRARQAMNINPRFVFFDLLPEGNPGLGPKGSLGVPLTPMGSIAVDPAFHAAGVPMFLQTTAPSLGGQWSGLMVAQDTGGAIKGAVRGDLFFGTGEAAGAAADTVNAPGRLWVLLPRAVAARLPLGDEFAGTQGLGLFAAVP